MVNEDLIKFLKERIGKHIKNVRVADIVANEELYVLFRSKELPILPFVVDLEGYPFKEVHLNFVAISWEKEFINIQTHIEFEVAKVYPIPIGYVGSLIGAKKFGPLLDPMDPEKIKTPLPDKHWFRHRTLNDRLVLDKLSKFINKSINGEKLWKQHNFVISFQDGNWVTTFSDKRGAEIFILPIDKPNTVQIQVSEFERFSPKKDNFFPKWKIDRTLDLLRQLFELYNEFVSSVDFEGYPHDKYLNGPEAFICSKCDSMVFPYKIHQKWPKFITLETSCPNCNKKSKILGHIDDERILEAASEFIWVCPKDLTPYNILKENQKKDKIIYELSCDSCKKKVKKEIDNVFHPIVQKGKGQSSPNLEKTEGNFIKYKF